MKSASRSKVNIWMLLSIVVYLRILSLHADPLDVVSDSRLLVPLIHLNTRLHHMHLSVSHSKFFWMIGNVTSGSLQLHPICFAAVSSPWSLLVLDILVSGTSGMGLFFIISLYFFGKPTNFL